MTNMIWTPNHTKLRNTLSQLYLDQESAQRIVVEAGMNPAAVTFSGSAENRWHAIIWEAERHALLLQLIERAIWEFPRNETLAEVFGVFKARGEIPELRNEVVLPDDIPLPIPDAEPQRVAKLYKSATRLVFELRNLDNEIQKIFSNVGLMTHQSLSDERRLELVMAVNNFARKEELVRDIRIHLGELQAQARSDLGELEEFVRHIIHTSWRFMDALGNSGVTPFGTPDQLHDFLTSIQANEISYARSMVHQECNKILNIVDRKAIAEAEIAVGGLGGVIKSKYPQLPI